jgi:predicted nucleic acid-binding Zn ribbon protein
MTDDPLQTCPSCGGKVKRLIGAGAGIIFKGHGFYETDYKKRGGGPGTKPAEDSSKQSGKKETATSPETKTTSGTSNSGAAQSKE